MVLVKRKEYAITAKSLETKHLVLCVGIYLLNKKNNVKGLMHFNFNDEKVVSEQYKKLNSFIEEYKNKSKPENICAILLGGKIKVKRIKRVLKKKIIDFPSEWNMPHSFLDYYNEKVLPTNSLEYFYYNYLFVKNSELEEYIEEEESRTKIKEFLEKKGISVEIRNKKDDFKNLDIKISENGIITTVEGKMKKLLDEGVFRTEKDVIWFYRKGKGENLKIPKEKLALVQ